MSYPPVIQFETRTIEAEARLRLERERETARRPKHRPAQRWTRRVLYSLR